MADKFAQRPTVGRFKLDQTRPGRIVRKTVVTKRSPLTIREHKGRTMRPMKKGR